MQQSSLIHLDYHGLETRVLSTGYDKNSIYSVPVTQYDTNGMPLDNYSPPFAYSYGRQIVNHNRMSNRQRKLYEKAENRYWRNQNKNG